MRAVAFAKMELGLSEDRFLEMTPAEVSVWIDVWRQRNRRQDQRAALLCCVMANINRSKKRKPYKIEDFMPREKTKQSSTPVDSEKLKKILKASFMFH